MKFKFFARYINHKLSYTEDFGNLFLKKIIGMIMVLRQHLKHIVLKKMGV